MSKKSREHHEILIYTQSAPLITSDGKIFVSIEALAPGDMIIVKSYGYTDRMPSGTYTGLILHKGNKEPWPFSAITKLTCYKLRTVLSSNDGAHYIDEFDVIEGTVYELVSANIERSN